MINYETLASNNASEKQLILKKIKRIHKEIKY